MRTFSTFFVVVMARGCVWVMVFFLSPSASVGGAMFFLFVMICPHHMLHFLHIFLVEGCHIAKIVVV